MKGRLIIISAPSGAGKSTIAGFLLGEDLGLEFSISATTRDPRGSEVNGKEYYFMTAEEFKKRVSDSEFAEWEEVYKDQFYGTLRSEIERIRDKGKNVLFDVDVKGGMSLKRLFNGQALSVFIMPPSVEELENRLVHRGTDSPARIKMRVEKAMEEMKLASAFDRVVINDDLENAKREVYNLVLDFIGD
jgi:guanylate kinase